jgi:hypothetical protein
VTAKGQAFRRDVSWLQRLSGAGDDRVGVSDVVLHCVLARRKMQCGDSGKKRAKRDARKSFFCKSYVEDIQVKAESSTRIETVSTEAGQLRSASASGRKHHTTSHPGMRIQMSDMNGTVALITGASSGIGRSTAEAFAAVSGIEALGGKATAIKTDVSVAKDVERMVAHALDQFGQIDFAVNNAGIEGKFTGIADFPEDDWARVLDVNLKGIFLCLKHEA